MLIPRLSWGVCVGFVALLVAASGAPAQVDWSDLFPEEGKPTAKPQRVEPAPAPARPAARTVEMAPPRPRQVAKPRPAPVPVQRAAVPKPSRRANPQQDDPDREFPAVPEVAVPQFDRHSNQTSSPAAAAPVQQAAARPPAPVAPEPVAVEDEPVVEKPRVAVPESAPAPVAARRADRIERPAAHESVQPATVPVADSDAAPPAAAVVRRAARAGATREVPPPAPAEVANVQQAGDSADAEAPLAGPIVVAMGSRSSAPPVDEPSLGVRLGDVITEKNMDKVAHLLSPGLEWAVRYGWRIKVGAPRRIEMIRPYREATEKHLGQPTLSPDGLRVLNWSTGQPFPDLDPNDPQVGVKIMWNYSYNFVATDDINAENFDADTGAIGKGRGMTVERHYMIDNLRRLNYTGRLFVDPKPVFPNQDDLRYKESIHPLSEPFDLKGVGGTFYRYNDPARQDDSWLYLPQLRRVRRLSTAQRSDALFGQDADIDSYYGYNGHIAWMDWKFLGERTVLAAVHAQNVPVKWQEPEDWAFDDVWEPRKVYVVEGTSKLPQYAYGKRIIFIDKEGWIVTHSDIYDRAGQLWKVWVNLYSFKKEVIPGARISRYPEEMGFVHAIVMLDTQLVHATRAALPSTHSQGEECVFLNMGEKSGTTEDFFSVANLIESGH